MLRVTFALLFFTSLSVSATTQQPDLFHTQPIDFLDGGFPSAIEVGQLTEMSLVFDDENQPTYLTFAIPDADFSATLEAVVIEQMYDSTLDLDLLTLSATTEDDVIFDDFKLTAVSYQFYSLDNAVTPAPIIDLGHFEPLADYHFEFEQLTTGNVSQGLLSSLVDINDIQGLVLYVLPEPSAVGLAFASCALMIARRRRRV